MKPTDLTQKDIDVLFHVANNSYGAAWQRACERAMECDGMTREEFTRVYSQLMTKLTNMEAA